MDVQVANNIPLQRGSQVVYILKLYSNCTKSTMELKTQN